MFSRIFLNQNCKFSYTCYQCLGSIKFWCGSGSWIRTGKKWIRIQVISSRFTEFFNKKNNFQIFVLFFSLIFILKLDEPFRNEEIFIISLFSKVQIWGLGVKKFFCSFWLLFYPLDPGPWIRIFLQIRIRADLSTDPDPKHCFLAVNRFSSYPIFLCK